MMDVVQVFNDELQSLVDIKPPVSKAKMGLITRAAMKGVKFYKHIVQSVEKFIAKCRPEYKVPGLYVIDSIVRQSRHQFGIERDVYASRFSRNLHTTFISLFSGCLVDDKPKIVRVLNLWQKNGVFDSQTIVPLLDMAANPNATFLHQSETTLSSGSPDEKHGQSSKYHTHHYNSGSNNDKSKYSKSNLKFSKNMLDFDYDEDDASEGDETPTEAEPPLSSTLNKIEMEQRGRSEMSAHQSSQNHFQPIAPSQQYQLQQHATSMTTVKTEIDPVLERWNRLIKSQSITSDDSHETSINEKKKTSRSRSRSPPSQSYRDRHHAIRETNQVVKKAEPIIVDNSARETRDAEREAERQRKCLPKIKDKHLTVCSSTLWLGHVPKTVSEADISDAFGEYGTITSIDLIPPRGCAYVCMDRRQDAKRALAESKDLKLNGSHIKMAWAPGKGFKEYKRLKDFWEVSVGASYIPYNKIDSSIDFDKLEEGGVIDEDSMSMEMREAREKKAKEKEAKEKGVHQPNLNLPPPTLPILSQPPPFAMPSTGLNIPPPPSVLGAGSNIGGIPFPPPNVSTASNNQKQNHNDTSLDHDSIDGISSPSIDQQISMTERQINMVEQQLNMIQHAQGIVQPQVSIATSMHHQALFHQTQPNPMLFDMHGSQMLHGAAQQMPIFANPNPILGQIPSMLPMSQVSMANNLNGNPMPPYNGRY